MVITLEWKPIEGELPRDPMIMVIRIDPGALTVSEDRMIPLGPSPVTRWTQEYNSPPTHYCELPHDTESWLPIEEAAKNELFPLFVLIGIYQTEYEDMVYITEPACVLWCEREKKWLGWPYTGLRPTHFRTLPPLPLK